MFCIPVGGKVEIDIFHALMVSLIPLKLVERTRDRKTLAILGLLQELG